MPSQKENKKANAELIKKYADMGVTYCEAHLAGCLGSMMLSFHHRHKRKYYDSKHPEWLSRINQTILVCANCHNLLEYDRDETERMFLTLRGEEILDESAERAN